MYQTRTHVIRSELAISVVGVESLTDRLDAIGKEVRGSGAAARGADTLLKEGQGRCAQKSLVCVQHLGSMFRVSLLQVTKVRTEDEAAIVRLGTGRDHCVRLRAQPAAPLSLSPPRYLLLGVQLSRWKGGRRGQTGIPRRPPPSTDRAGGMWRRDDAR